MKQYQHMNIKPSRPKPTTQISNQHFDWEEGGRQTSLSHYPEPSRPTGHSREQMVAPIMRSACPKRINALDEIAKLSGERPANWQKPSFGEFEYWLGHNCGWITDTELQIDREKYELKRQTAVDTSQRFSQQRFSWLETPQHADPTETDEYVPQINMKLIKDRNLTDSSRRIAMFVLRHAYQDNRAGRFIGMTVSFIMNGLSLSRRTVQRSLTLLETRGYFHCEVAKGDKTRMCIGLIIRLQRSLFPRHHQKKWPERSRNPEASKLPHKQEQFNKTVYGAKHKVSRLNWALKCMNAITRKSNAGHNNVQSAVNAGGGRFKPTDASFLLPLVKQSQQRSIPN